MSYSNLLNSISKNELSIEEEVEAWKNLTPDQKAQIIKETKDEGKKEEIAHLLEVANMAVNPPSSTVSPANTSAGGSGTVTGDEILARSTGTSSDQVSDTDPLNSSKNQFAAAAGIGAGLGAVNMAKKLRRVKAGSGVIQSQPMGA
jgi:hypothetical protein